MKHLLVSVAFLLTVGGCESEGVEGATTQGAAVQPHLPPPTRGAANTSPEGLQPEGLQPEGLRPDGGVATTDVQVGSVTLVKTDAQVGDLVSGAASGGVTVNLGKNPCPNASLSGWDPATGACYTGPSGTCKIVPQNAQEAAFQASHPSAPVCGDTYAPGTLLIWSSTDPRFHYLADVSGGNVCLPNVTSYVVPSC
jgi:hypothetical protein